MTHVNVETYPDALAKCHRCRATDHLITGDGPTVCRPCVDLLGEVSGDPLAASPRLRETLSELHADVLELVNVEDAPARGVALDGAVAGGGGMSLSMGRRSPRSLPTGPGSRGGHWHEAEFRAAYFVRWRRDHPEYREHERRRRLLTHAVARLTRVMAGGTYARPAS